MVRRQSLVAVRVVRGFGGLSVAALRVVASGLLVVLGGLGVVLRGLAMFLCSRVFSHLSVTPFAIRV